MKRSLFVLLVSAVAVTSTQAIFAAEAYYEDRPMNPRDSNGVSEWWAKSWQTGDTVTTKAQYQITGEVTVTPEVKWYSFWEKWMEYGHKTDIRGVSTYHSSVLSGGNSEVKAPVQLLRTYECPMSTRGMDIVGFKDGLAAEKMLREKYENWYKISQMPEMKTFLDNSYRAGKIALQAYVTASATVLGSAATGGTAAVPACGLGSSLGKLAGESLDLFRNWATRKAEDFHRSNLEKLAGGKFDEEGGVEAKSNGWFYRKVRGNGEIAKEGGNWAATMNGHFNGKTFYMAGTIGDDLFARQLVQDDKDSGGGNDAWRIWFSSNGDSKKLYEDMQAETEESPSEKKVCDIIKRETLSINEELFGCKQRKIGDVWETDAKILDGYLHADLEGRFDGIMFVKYVRDEDISLTLFNDGNPFMARHIKMQKDYKGKDSKVRYSEPSGFEVRYGTDEEGTDVEINFWVDMKTGYIVRVTCDFKGAIKGLPHTRLTEGLKFKEATGDVVFSMVAENLVESVLSKK